MCIIIYAPKGHVPKKQLSRCIHNNDDGWGVMWPENGKLRIVKGMTEREFAIANKWIKDIRAPKVFHFRITTHGKTDLDHCHPFLIPGHGECAVAHNGIISKQTSTGTGSDTMNFVSNILADMPIGFQGKEAYRLLIEDYIGYSKLVFMDGEGNVDIYNQEKGSWDGDNWYSNNSYKDWYSKTSHSCGFFYNSPSATTPTQEVRVAAPAIPKKDINSMSNEEWLAYLRGRGAINQDADELVEIPEELKKEFDDFSAMFYEENPGASPADMLEDWEEWIAEEDVAVPFPDKRDLTAEEWDGLTEQEWSARKEFEASRAEEEAAEERKAKPLTGTMSAAAYKQKLREDEERISRLESIQKFHKCTCVIGGYHTGPCIGTTTTAVAEKIAGGPIGALVVKDDSVLNGYPCRLPEWKRYSDSAN